jgi:hypothetical protein
MDTHFTDGRRELIRKMFMGVRDLFEGHYPGYQRSDSFYHDLAHTFEATIATARILDGHLRSGNAPRLRTSHFELAVAAALLHDSGYIKEVGDNEGTGAKYTLTHVQRSIEFSTRFLEPLDIKPKHQRIVHSAILCTGLNVDMSRAVFENEAERYIGCALGSGDILGQMASPDYPQWLPLLYREYVEAVQYSGCQEVGIARYASALDLLRQTRSFYEKHVRRMLEEHWDGVYHALDYHYDKFCQPYQEAIERNLDRIDQLVAQQSQAPLLAN